MQRISRQQQNLKSDKMNIHSDVKQLRFSSVNWKKFYIFSLFLIVSFQTFTQVCAGRNSNTEYGSGSDIDTIPICQYCQKTFSSSNTTEAAEARRTIIKYYKSLIQDKITNALGSANINNTKIRNYAEKKEKIRQITDLYRDIVPPIQLVNDYDGSDEEGVTVQDEFFDGRLSPAFADLDLDKQKPHAFDLIKSNLLNPNTYKSANLTLLFPTAHDCKESANITIHYLGPVPQVTRHREHRFTAITHITGIDVNKMVSIDITKQFRNILEMQYPLNDITLSIKVNYRKNAVLSPGCPDVNKNSSLVLPMLKITYNETVNKRSKRAPKVGLSQECTDDNHATQTQCCRRRLKIDFDEFKWDFIITPRTYDAYYCAGDCGPFWAQKYPHTHLVTMTGKNLSSPCCSPRKLASINMLYWTVQDTIVFGRIPGMVVEKCGCS